MQRNLRNEVLIAIGAMATIVCGLFFALLLSNSSTPPTPTNISSSLVTSVVQSNTDDSGLSTEITEEVVASETDVPSETPEPTATATDTDIPSETFEPTATDTDAPSETFEPTVTNTDAPSETPELTVTNTDAPSETSEPKSTETEIPSDTPEPTVADTDTPSETPEPTATDTDVPSDTPEPMATNTDVPSDTPEPTATLIPSETARPSATSTSVNAVLGIIPTLPATPTVVPLNEPTRTPASCVLPQGWTTYTVQVRDTLFAISLVTNSTVDELRFANCIDDIDNITAGDAIFVPIAPVSAVSTLVPSGIRQGLATIGCTNQNAQITSPITAQRITGLFNVYGTAIQDDFQYYKLEVRPDFADIYNFYSSSESQVRNGVLSLINADLFGDGLHWIRLTVVDIRGGIRPDSICEIPVIFE